MITEHSDFNMPLTTKKPAAKKPAAKKSRNLMERFGRRKPTLIPELPVISWRQVDTPVRDFFQPHYFSHHHLVIVSSGSFECWVQGRLVHMKKGMMMLFKPYEILASLANSLIDGRIYSFQFDLYNPQALNFCSEEAQKTIIERLRNFTMSPLLSQNVLPLVEKIFEEHRQPRETSSFVCRQLFNETLIKLLREEDNHLGKAELDFRQASEIMNVVEKLNVASNSTVSVEELADHFGYTAIHFRRIFKAICGMTPVKYLQ